MWKLFTSTEPFGGRGHQNLFFWDLFFLRNYLFVADLLAVSRLLRTLTVPLSPFSLYAHPHSHLHPQYCVGFCIKMYMDFLINPNKSQKDESWNLLPKFMKATAGVLIINRFTICRGNWLLSSLDIL